jgi:hypothetical protein
MAKRSVCASVGIASAPLSKKIYIADNIHIQRKPNSVFKIGPVEGGICRDCS